MAACAYLAVSPSQQTFTSAVLLNWYVARLILKAGQTHFKQWAVEEVTHARVHCV